MRKLMRANLARLWRSKAFWACMILLAVLAVALIYDNANYERDPSEVVLMNIAPVIPLVLAPFIALFLGAEYSNGAIRNKLIVGSHRSAIYLSNLLTCVIAGVLMLVAFAIPALLLGELLKTGLSISWGSLLSLMLMTVIVSIASTSIFTCGAMLMNNRGLSAVILVIGAFALLIVADMFIERLDTPPTMDNYVEMTMDGEMLRKENVPNRYYISGTKREIYQFISDILPAGQAIRLANVELPEDSGWKYPLYSAIVTLLTSGIGLFFFRRKNIK